MMGHTTQVKPRPGKNPPSVCGPSYDFQEDYVPEEDYAPKEDFDKAGRPRPDSVRDEDQQISDYESTRSNSKSPVSLDSHIFGRDFSSLLNDELVDLEDDVGVAHDVLEAVVGQLLYPGDHCTTANATCPSCYSKLTARLEADLLENGEILQVLEEAAKTERGLQWLGIRVHTAYLTKGLAAEQLKRALLVFRSHVAELKAQEVAYHYALKKANVKPEVLTRIERSSKDEALRGLAESNSELRDSFAFGKDFALLPSYNITPQSIMSTFSKKSSGVGAH